jgi:glucose/arabinose dehydrogenase/PKD repeat protein
MSNPTTRSSLVWLLAAAGLVYACGDDLTPSPKGSGGSAGLSNGAGVPNNGGAAQNGGNGTGGSTAGSGGTPGQGGGDAQGGAGEEPIPVYEQDDPNLIPVETDFQRVQVPVNLHNAMQIDVDRDENVYILERDGALRIWKTASGEVVDAGLLDTFSGNEDGALGFALDPSFEDNHYAYIYYSSGTAMEQKLSRFVLENAALELETEKVLFTVPDDREVQWHVSGGLAFDSKGNLYVSLGDNTNPFESNGYSPHDEGAGRKLYDAQRTAANSMDLRGKILRITPTADGKYTTPADNLWTADEGRPEIYVMGDRNPFRIAIDPKTDWLYWGEVGPDAAENGDALDTRGPRGYDEFNQAKAAGFFGWPYCIADNKPYVHYDFTAKTSGAKFDCAAPVNDSPNNTGAKALPPAQPSWLYYSYGSGQYPELGTVGGRTAVMGTVFRWAPGGSINKLPRHYDGSKFIMEYSRGWINEVRTDDEGKVLSIVPFMAGQTWKELISMRVSPNGVMYVAQYGSDSTVYRLNYVGKNNQPPVAVAKADKDSGPTPLTVTFSSEGSSDPEGKPLTYAWDFDGDGTADSTEANPTFVYQTAGSFNVKLTVSDGAAMNATASASVTVVAGNTKPVVTITSPPAGGFIAQGQQVDYTVSVTDAEDGSTPGAIPCSNVTVNTALGHDVHEHDGAPTSGCSGTFTAATGLINTENTWQVLNVSYQDKGTGALSLLGAAKLKLHFTRLEAEHYDRQGEAHDVQNEDTTDVGLGQSVAFINDGSYLCWNEMNFQGITSITYRVASANTGGRIELHQDSPIGPAVGGQDQIAQVAPTGGWQTWVDVTVPLTGASGTHKYCFLFARNPGDKLLFNVNWMQFGGTGVGK